MTRDTKYDGYSAYLLWAAVKDAANEFSNLDGAQRRNCLETMIEARDTLNVAIDKCDTQDVQCLKH